MKTLLARTLVATSLVSIASPLVAAAADEPAREIRSIEVWTRSAGATGDVEPAKLTPIAVASIAPRTFERLDPQYGKKYTFRGFSFVDLLTKAGPPAGADLALLHFSNGMAIPIPFRDAAVMKRLDPMIALAIVADGKPQPLPAVTRKTHEYVDVPAIAFEGNKVVVAEGWHPMLAADTKGWSPWKHAASLAAIEFVTAAPYYAQFDVGRTDASRAGFGLFKQNCQFCHGARGIGAKLGWDFVEPVPLYTWRGSPHQLYMHVAYRRLDAPERNEMMPALKHMSEEDAVKVWRWLEAIGTTPLRPYAPVAAAAAK
jgi:mono/diheme cytochrome c family protein